MAMFPETTDMSLNDIRMSSKDLLDKEELDAGGFGMVSLCLHRNHGLVVLKKVYTGPQRTEYNAALLEEGKIMHRLDHNRVLKLLGLILEDGNYSLVMEFMKKGNLMNVLKMVTVPQSVKGRIILEIIEGMSYLNEQGVVHKDLKPENILVDDDFHIKIADLGVASFKTWSKLTKEETNRQRKMKSTANPKTNAGTLFYMAPEHLKSVNAKPTEKSDVYSFGIVLWVILANKEPYENAFNEDQVFFCIISGNRPNVDEVDWQWPQETVALMKHCWDQSPEKRPTFAECDQKFRPLYCLLLEPAVEDGVRTLKTEYPRPRDFVMRMESLQLDCVAEPPSSQATDLPRSLHSSQGLVTDNPVDEAQFAPCVGNEPEESEATDDYSLERKLQDELSYHQKGSRLDQLESQPHGLSSARTDERSRRVFHEPLITNPVPQKIPESNPGNAWSHNQNLNAAPKYKWNVGKESFSQTWLNHSKILGAGYTPEEIHRINNGPGGVSEAATQNRSHSSFTPQTQTTHGWSSPRPPVPESGLPGPLPMKPSYSFPNSIMPEIGTRDTSAFQKGHFGYTVPPPVQSMVPQDESPKSVALVDTTGVQIGNNNIMHIGHMLQKSPSNPNSLDSHRYYENQGIFARTTLAGEQHLNLVRDNLAKQWKTCARKLGLRDPEIDEIDHDYERDGLREKVYQMLQKWQMREGTNGSTVGKLAQALYACQRTDLLNELIALLHS